MEVIISDPFYSSMLVCLGMILVLLEVFIPSFGVLGLLALCFASLGIYGFFYQDRGYWAFASLLLLVGFTIVILFYATRRLQLTRSLSPEVVDPAEDDARRLDGKEGITLTPLRPAGLARIDGQRIDVVATGRFIDKDRKIRVVETKGNRVVVQEVPQEISQEKEPTT